MFDALEIVIHLDGTGVYYDPSEPPMLDAILAAALVRWHIHGEPPGRDEEPFEVPLPLKKWQIEGNWGWHASALFPVCDEAVEQVIHWRKRFRQKFADLTTGSPNTTNGTYRDWNMPLPLLMTPKLVGYAFGERNKILKTLARDVRYIGKKRAHGRGRVTGIDVTRIPLDKSLVHDGQAMRYLPLETGFRAVRMRPPYWSRWATSKSCEISDPYSL